MKINVLNEVYTPTLKTMYELVVKYMCGDANAYFTETHHFHADDVEDLYRTILGLEFMKGLPRYSTKVTDREALLTFFEGQGFPYTEDEDEDSDTYMEYIPHEVVQDFIDLFVLNDNTDESYEYNARVKEISLFYYDAVGRKFYAEYTK